MKEDNEKEMMREFRTFLKIFGYLAGVMFLDGIVALMMMLIAIFA